MINNTLQIPIAAALFLTLIFVLLHYAKPRKDQTEFIIGLLKNLSEKDGSEEKEICSEKRKY